MIKIKSVETCIKAEENKEIVNGVNAYGIFDNLTNPVYPVPLQTLSIIVSFENMTVPTIFEARINSPAEDLIGKTTFGVAPDQYGFGRKILDLSNFLVMQRGKYTIDFFSVETEGKPKFIETKLMFIADYPPQRIFADGEKERILSTENVVKSLNTEFLPPELMGKENVSPFKIQYSLDPKEELQEGYIAMPEDGILKVAEGEFDVTGIKRHIEWMFGREIPKEEAKKEESKESETTDKKEHFHADGSKCCGGHNHEEGHTCGCGHKH